MQLQGLLYLSSVKILDGLFEFELSRILDVARTHNSANDITGCLLFSDRYFIQLLEGDEEAVTHLFNRISADTRHTDVRLMQLEPIDERAFTDWDMASLGLHDMPNAFVRRYAPTGNFNPYKLEPDRLGTMVRAVDRNLLQVA